MLKFKKFKIKLSNKYIYRFPIQYKFMAMTDAIQYMWVKYFCWVRNHVFPHFRWKVKFYVEL